MKDVLQRTMRPGDLEDAVICLVKGKAQNAYQEIWKKIRPFGKEAGVTFYEEGRGE